VSGVPVRPGLAAPRALRGIVAEQTPVAPRAFSARGRSSFRADPASYALDSICAPYHNGVVWEVEFTDEFEEWWDTLSEDQQDAVRERVDLLAQRGPALKRPLVGEVQGSAFGAQMKELRASRDGPPPRPVLL